MKKHELEHLARQGLEAEIARLNALVAQLGPRRGRITSPKRTYTMSPAQRKAVSIRMKGYWAARREWS